MTIEDFLSRLNGVTSVSGGFMALCPAHDDRKPSLSIKPGDDGRVLMKCFAGCSTDTILDALGLNIKDLIPNGNGNGKNTQKIEKTYDYADESGELVYQVVRYLPKDFKQRRPDGKGG